MNALRPTEPDAFHGAMTVVVDQPASVALQDPLAHQESHLAATGLLASRRAQKAVLLAENASTRHDGVPGLECRS